MSRGGLLVLGALAACGGGSAPAQKTTVVQEATRPTRVPVKEDPDDGVEIVSSRGHMEPAVVDAGIDPHKADLSACYMSRVGRRRWLGGKVTMHWDINRAGEVTRLVLSESDLGAWSVEKCLLDVAKQATFGKPVGGDADFSVPLEFNAVGRPAVWDEDQSLRAVGGQLAKLDECAKPPRHNPKVKTITVPDDVVITLYVGPAGAPQSVGFASRMTVIDEHWAACAEKQAMAWRLPDPKGNVAKLAVRYRAK
ncbi:MAG: AgmX/PglI C-terminal domain-containing protein [Deltaproteobacteria bacterium]|nr:AgmX/PglI C-terminal domain-containing protein [Deltaproteobacteria bacterium]